MNNVMFVSQPVISEPRVSSFNNGGSIITFLIPATGTQKSAAGEKLSVSVTIPSYLVERYAGVIQKGMHFSGVLVMGWKGMRVSNDPEKYGPTWDATFVEGDFFEGRPVYGNAKGTTVTTEVADSEF